MIEYRLDIEKVESTADLSELGCREAIKTRWGHDDHTMTA